MQHSTDTSEAKLDIPEEFAENCDLKTTDTLDSESKFNIPEEFVNKSDLKTKALEVNGELLWVCPQVLASKSSVFHTMFFGEYLEQETDIIPIKDKDLKDFIDFLQCLNASPEAFKSLIFTNYPAILKLADEFDASSLVEIVFNLLLPKFEQFKYDVAKHAVEIMEIVTLAHHFKHQQTIDSFFPIYCQVPYKKFKENYESLPPELRELYLVNRADNQPDLSRFPPGDLFLSQSFSGARGLQLRFRVENFSKFTETRKKVQELSGPLGYAGGFQWEIRVIKQGNSRDLDVFLQCCGDPVKSWNCTARFVIRLLAQVNALPDLRLDECTQKFEILFDSWGNQEGFSLDEVENPKNGYIKDDSIIVEVVFRILETSSKEGLLIKESEMPVSSFVDKKVKHLFQKDH